jgi:hypothetical protein
LVQHRASFSHLFAGSRLDTKHALDRFGVDDEAIVVRCSILDALGSPWRFELA